MANMTSAQSQAWNCLKPIEQQSLFLQLSEGKSSWEAGNVLGITDLRSFLNYSLISLRNMVVYLDQIVHVNLNLEILLRLV